MNKGRAAAVAGAVLAVGAVAQSAHAWTNFQFGPLFGVPTGQYTATLRDTEGSRWVEARGRSRSTNVSEIDPTARSVLFPPFTISSSAWCLNPSTGVFSLPTNLAAIYSSLSPYLSPGCPSGQLYSGGGGGVDMF